MEVSTIKRKLSEKEKKKLQDECDELEKELEELEDQLNSLYMEKAKNELKIKIIEDRLKNPIYHYIDGDLIENLKSI